MTMLRVLTWNVGRLYLGRFGRGDSRLADEDLGRVAAALEASADVAALQELRLEGTQLDSLLEHLGPGWRGAVPATGNGHSDRRVAVLARARLDPRFAIVPIRTGRAAAAALLPAAPALPPLAQARPAIAVLAFHVDAFSAPLRSTQLDELSAWAVSRPEPIVLLGGDLNIDLDHPVTHLPADRDTARLVAEGFVDVGRGHGPTWLLGRRLDYLLLRRPAPSSLRLGAAVLGALRLPLGDHLPVLARLA